MKTTKIRHAICILLSVIFWIAVWQIASMKINSSLIIPSPLETVKKTVELIGEEGFLKSCVGSVLRIFFGAVIGIALGTLLAALCRIIRGLKYLTLPVMTVIKATPVASFIVLLLILIGKNHIPSVTSALISIPILWANVSEGIDGVDKSLVEVCDVYKIPFFKRLRVLWIPSVLPSFKSGIKSCIGLSWKAGIAAEVLCTPTDSIGLKIHETRIYLETAELFAWTLVVIILSLAFEKLALSLFSGRRKK